MPANKFAFLRYQIIDDCLRNTMRPYPGLEDLRRACEEKLFSSDGERVSASTIEKDLAAMRNDPDLGYEAPIAYNRTHRGYSYTDPDYTIKQFSLSDEQREAMQFAARTLVQFKDFPIFDAFHDAIQQISDRLEIAPDLKMSQNADVVQFESAPRTGGSEWLAPLLGHIRNREVVRFGYQKFGGDESATYELEPLLLKEHRNRWYVVGQDQEKGRLRTFGLDRIVRQSLEYTGRKFTPPAGFDPAAHFANSLGVIVLDANAEDCLFHINRVLTNYLKTTPMHPSQRIVERPDGVIELHLHVQLTFELTQMILGYGNEIEVVAPPQLRSEVQQKLRATLAQYD